jgi:hypothetical protein
VLSLLGSEAVTEATTREREKITGLTFYDEVQGANEVNRNDDVALSRRIGGDDRPLNSKNKRSWLACG